MFAHGEVLGDAYEIRGVLGQGGMGAVYDAHDRNLGRRVAIKANFPEMRFSVRTEARALAALKHPGVVAVYALGQHRGVDFMVMEHVSGVTLDRHLERLGGGVLPLVERLDVLIAVADGLAAIHRAGISHGDVKLENVLLAASGRVVLTDLGLVRAAYEPDTGLIAGTIAYMAPEIVSPRFKNAGWHLIDAFAFGVLAFRLLADRFPYEEIESDLDLVLANADRPAPKLSEVAPEMASETAKPKVRIPKRLEELVAQLLEKEPVDRPATMDAVVWQLRAVRADLTGEGRLAARQPEGPTSMTEAAPPLVVLVVDDDRELARLVGMYVKQAAPNAEIQLAHDAKQALDAFRKKPPRLVFLDLMMPKTSGFELFTYLRGVHLVDASTVVAMSAGGSPTDVQLMLELGAYDFIPKGAELRPRVTKIVQMLARHRDPAT
jgi:eukaryotic-like serine/threonine-protein kinase